MKQTDLKNIYDNQTTNIIKYENNIYRLNTKYKIGKIIISGTKATLLIHNSSQKIFVDFDKLNGAYHNDTVITQVLFNPKGKIKAKVIQLVKQDTTPVLCIVQDKNLFSIKEYIEIDCEIVNNQNGDVVIFQNGKISSKFGNISDSKIDQKISLFLYNQYYRLDEFSHNSFVQIDTSKRIDLTHLEFVTIDPQSAKDHDDAIYFNEKSFEIFIAIADVSAYVQEDSNTDNDALKRAFSIYFPHKVLPMLPFELSTNLCSLVPDKLRPAYVFKIKLDKQTLKVVSSNLFEANIISKHKYSYQYIDEVLMENNPSNIYTKLFNVTKKLKRNRLKNGFDFRNDEIRLILDDDENIKDFHTETSSPSHSLVEECMLLANQESAKRLKTIGIYRTHDEPTPAKIKKLVEDVNFLGIKASLKKDVHSTIISIQQKAKNINLEQEVDELIIQSQQQASYSSIKSPHFGLGFDDYSHFTSPIRRYSDLVLHRILKTNKIPKDIEIICEDISRIEREISSLVWDYEDRKYARYLSNHINKEFMATIVDVENNIATLNEEVKGARVTIENYEGEKLFSKIKVKILNCDIISKKIYVKII